MIRSQDKSILVNMDNVSSIVIDKRVKGSIKIFEGGADPTGYEIARYSTDEKAMKVLDMIQAKYNLSKTFGGSCVIEMPADEDVGV